MQDKEGAEPSKAAIAAERRERLRVTAAQLMVTVAGVMESTAPGAGVDGALKSLLTLAAE